MRFFALALLLLSSLVGAATVTPAGSPPTSSVLIPATDPANHGSFGVSTAGGYYGTAGTLTNVTASTTNNSTAATFSASHGVTVGQYVTIGSQVGAFRVTGVSTNDITLNRVATATASGQAVQYIQRLDEVIRFGYNLPNKTSEPIWSWRLEADYLDTDGYRKVEGYLQYNEPTDTGSTQIRPFFAQINRDLHTLDYTWVLAGTSSTGGFYVNNVAGTRNIARFVDGTNFGSVTLDADLTIGTNIANSTIINLNGNVNGANNTYLKHFGKNASNALVEFGSMAVLNSTRTAGAETGRMRFFVTEAGVVSTAAIDITGSIVSIPGQFVLTTTRSPASNASCPAGRIDWDSGFLYICTASGVVKRVAVTGGY